ncbi:MAG: hypothetical protein KatS3mg076_3194 [Candidatus Binatia bacterium]|nr:MAG: hypothetical protein KatS3mg076_3194 [Candidatus Binatia bacterium]
MRAQAVLLSVHPVISVGYLLSIRRELLPPSFVPALLLAVLPVLSILLGTSRYRTLDLEGRRTQWILFVLAAAELLWAVVALAMVGFAVALRSG